MPKRSRVLLGAALLVFGLGWEIIRAQADIGAIRNRAEQGDAEAMNALANAHATGTGVPQDMGEAIRLYQRAAERGLAAASFNLGMIHELGRGVGADPATAFGHYLKAAELGFAPAQFNVGNMYANGVGTNLDYFEAALWFRQAADRGVPEAQYNLALAYELGRGVARDEEAALRWYRVAATQGYARAQYNLALMLEEGRGTPADAAAAAEHYRAAALQNFAPAQNNLGILLAEGRGVPADPVDAYTWLALAVENGTRSTGRDIVAQQLTSAQLTQANIRIAQLRPQLGLRDRPASAVASSAQPPATAEPQAAGSVTVAEVGALNTRIANAEAEAERLRTENARLAESARDLSREKAALEQRLATGAAEAARTDQAEREQLNRQVALLQAAVSDARQTADRLAAENAALRSAASPTPGDAVAQGGAAPPPDAAASDARIAKLMSDNARLNEDVKRATIELSQLGRQLRIAQEKLERGESGGAPAGGADEAKLADLTGQIEQLQSENQRLTADNHRLSTATTVAPAAGAELTARLDAVTAERDRLAALLADASPAQAALAQVQQARDVLAAEKAELERRLGELSAADPEVVRQRDTLAAEKKALEQQALQYGMQLSEARSALQLQTQANAGIAARIDTLTAERDRLAASRTDSSPAQAALAHVQQARDVLVGEKMELERRLGELSVAAAESRQRVERVEESNRTLVQRLGAATAERERLAAGMQGASESREMVEKLSAQLDAAGRSIADLNAKNDSLEKDLEVARQSVAAALAAQATAAQAAPSEAMKLELQTLQNHVRTLEMQGEEDRRNSAREMSALAAQLSNARESNRALADANRSLLQARGSEDAVVKSEIEELSARLKAAGSELEKSRADQAALQARMAEAARGSETHGAAVAELTGVNERLAADKAALERELGQLRQNSGRTQAELDDLRHKAVAADAAAKEQVAAVSELTALNGRLQGQVHDLTGQLESLRADNARLAASGGEATALRNELADLRARLD
ncbi:MAG: hypothetical protein WD941_02925, partial [Opitutus sp.]